jgi:hypothetical protein
VGCVVDQYAVNYDDLGKTSAGLRVNSERATFRPSPLGFALLAACQAQGKEA